MKYIRKRGVTMLAEFKDMYVSATEFRTNMSEILKGLDKPKVVVSRNNPVAVVMPYEDYIKMEKYIELQKQNIEFDAMADELLGE